MSLLFSALYVKCLYYVVLNMQSVLINKCLICNVQVQVQATVLGGVLHSDVELALDATTVRPRPMVGYWDVPMGPIWIIGTLFLNRVPIISRKQFSIRLS